MCARIFYIYIRKNREMQIFIFTNNNLQIIFAIFSKKCDPFNNYRREKGLFYTHFQAPSPKKY